MELEMCKNNLQSCRDGKDFLELAKSKQHQHISPVDITFGKGDHVKVTTPLGVAIFPVGHELGKGLRHVVIKSLIAIGISVVLLVVVFQNWI